MTTQSLFRWASAALLILAWIVPETINAQGSSTLSPILIEPYDGENVAEQQIVWSWFMQSSAADGSEIFCDLVLVEVLEGQSIEEAMRLNPPVILKENLTTSSWQTSPFARSLQHGRKYAWHIVAKVRNERGGFRQISESEMWQLTFVDPAVVADRRSEHTEPLPPGDNPISDSNAVVVNDTLLASGTGTEQNDRDGSSEDGATDSSSGGERSEGDADVSDASKRITIAGQARHTFATENRRGNLSTAPVRFDRLQFEPSVVLFGVPLNLSLLVTTEENLRQSDVSRGAFGTTDARRGLNVAVQQRIESELGTLEQQRDSAAVDSLRAFVSSDSATIAQRIAVLENISTEGDAQEQLETLEELNLLTEEQRTMADFPSFGFGKVAPNFGSLLLNRVTINGGAIEYNPEVYYVAGAIGKLQRVVDPAALPQEALANDSALQADPLLSVLEFHRNIYSFRLGYGRRQGNHVALTGLYADDDEQSRTLQDIVNRPIQRFIEVRDSLGELTRIDTVLEDNHVVGRQRNYGLGAVGRYEIDSIGLTLDGEFNLSWFDDDANRPGQLLIPLPQALPSFLEKDSVLTDYNFALRSHWELPWQDAGELDAGIRYIGGGYRSVGVAGLRTDVLRADARYNAILLDRQVRAGLRYSFEQAGYKDSSNSSRLNALGASVELRPRGWPSLTLAYQKHSQTLETSKRDTALHQITDNAIEELSATLTSLRQWSDIRWSLFASASMRNGSSSGGGVEFQPDSAGVFRSRVVQLDNRIAFGNTVTFGVFGGYTGTENHPLLVVEDSTGTKTLEVRTDESNVFNIDISALVEPVTNWQLTVGAIATYQDSIATPAILGGYVSSRYALGEWGGIELRFDYRQTALPDLETTFPVERIGRIITTVKW